MRRLLVITALALTAAACGSAGDGSTTEAAPDSIIETAADAPVDPATETPAVEAIVVDEPAAPPISLPASSGDPDLDALGAELDGLEQELSALAATTADVGANP